MSIMHATIARTMPIATCTLSRVSTDVGTDAVMSTASFVAGMLNANSAPSTANSGNIPLFVFVI
jgi:hypothetical protein